MLWVSDFTYVATWKGLVYVAFIIDSLTPANEAISKVEIAPFPRARIETAQQSGTKPVPADCSDDVRSAFPGLQSRPARGPDD